MSCTNKTAATTIACDTNTTRRHWPALRFADPVTNDMNNPGGYTLIGNNIANLGDVLQTVSVLAAATDKLFIQLAICSESNGAGQVEITTFVQS